MLSGGGLNMSRNEMPFEWSVMNLAPRHCKKSLPFDQCMLKVSYSFHFTLIAVFKDSKGIFCS